MLVSLSNHGIWITTKTEMIRQLIIVQEKKSSLIKDMYFIMMDNKGSFLNQMKK